MSEPDDAFTFDLGLLEYAERAYLGRAGQACGQEALFDVLLEVQHRRLFLFEVVVVLLLQTAQHHQSQRFVSLSFLPLQAVCSAGGLTF